MAWFAAGQTVLVQGLQSAPQHNGKSGTLLSFDASKLRWSVRMCNAGVGLSVKPDNLVSLPANDDDNHGRDPDKQADDGEGWGGEAGGEGKGAEGDKFEPQCAKCGILFARDAQDVSVHFLRSDWRIETQSVQWFVENHEKHDADGPESANEGARDTPLKNVRYFLRTACSAACCARLRQAYTSIYDPDSPFYKGGGDGGDNAAGSAVGTDDEEET